MTFHTTTNKQSHIVPPSPTLQLYYEFSEPNECLSECVCKRARVNVLRICICAYLNTNRQKNQNAYTQTHITYI